jgi:PAS domain S-box-containing protein
MRLIPIRSTPGGTSNRFFGGGDADEARAEVLRRRIVSFSAINALAAALAVLVSWQFGIRWGLSPYPGNSLMTPDVAVCFVLASLSLWLLRSGAPSAVPQRASYGLAGGPDGWRLRLARISAFAMAVVSLHYLVEGVFRIELHIDRIFFRHELDWPAVPPALTTSIALLLLGVSLLLTGRRISGAKLRNLYYSEMLCIPALFVGLMGAVGYAMGAHGLLLEFPALMPLPISTAFCAGSLAFGILFVNGNHHFARIVLSREPGGVMARRVLPSAAATLFVLGWLDLRMSRSELLHQDVAMAVLIVAGTFVLASVVLWTASLLNRDADERRSAAQSVAYLSALVEWSTDAIVGKTLEGTVASWNHGAEKLYGYTAAEVVGRSADVLMPPGLSTELREHLARLGRGERIEQYETVRQRKDGTVIDVAVRLSPILNAAGEVIGASSIARDITAAKRAEENLRQAKQEWEQTFNSVPDLIAVLDRQHRVVRVNRALAERLGRTAEQCIGEKCYRIVHGTSTPPAECPHSLTLIDCQQHIAEVREQLLDGDFVVSTSPFFDQDGELAGTVHVSREISELKKAHQALLRSEKLATTGQLAATIAHEIHNPLDVVSNLLFLVEQGSKEDEPRKFATMALEELGRVTQITQQMLTFQREATAPIPVSIPEVVETVLALYQRKILAAGITIEQEVASDASIVAMPGQTRQVFANLIGNAIEAMKRSEGRIRVRAYRSHDWRTGEAGLRFLVADNGHGIPLELQKKIFDPFFTTKGEKGTGLGLWITLGIIEKSRGSLRLRSTTREGRSGTCFSIFFPASSERPASFSAAAMTPELPFPK